MSSSRRWTFVVGALAAIAASACKSKRASVEDVFSTRLVGLSYLRRNQLPEAEAEFKKLVDMAPDDPQGYADLGLTYLQAGRYADAEKQLKRAKDLDAASADIALTLAKVYALTGRPRDARAVLEKVRRDSTTNAQVLYALADLDAQASDSAGLARYQNGLRAVLGVAPANLAARLALVKAFVRQGAGAADSAVRQLEEIRRIPPAPPREASVYLDSTIQLLRGGSLPEARETLARFSRLLEVTSPYQASLNDAKATEGPIAGRPVLDFAPKSLITMLGVKGRATGEAVRFTDVTDDAGLSEGPPAAGAAPTATGVRAASALAAGDADGNGTDDIFVSSPAASRLYRMQAGFARDVTASSGISLAGGATFATFADYDNDGWLDLYAIGGDGRGRLFHNKGNGAFDDATAKAGIADVKGARKGVFIDLDHDGDLDLLLVGNAQRTVYRNNLDGTFTEAAAALGLAGSGDARDVAFADVDGDGRVDLVVTNAAGAPALLHNGGAQRFSDVTATSGLSGLASSGVVAVGDYDNDGFFDLFVTSATGGDATLWRNDRNGTFRRDDRSAGALGAVRAIAGRAAAFVDIDNDGWLDLVIAGAPGTSGGKGGAALLHNDGGGRFSDRSSLLPASVRSAGGTAITVSDIDGDGDEDLFLADASGAARLLRNDGGNANLAVNVQLKALRTGSGKNNDFGVGARIELRAGDIYQTRVATGRVTHFGLGPHLKADVLRIEWPNGVPQTVYFPGTDQDVVESEMLKGSCALAYTWDGKRFRFVTDAMWRSALGMPLGLMSGGGHAFAPAGASQEYLRIPGEVLQPKDGRYLLQLTEELWETAYADEVKLIAVDHPESVSVFVDERFVPPGPVTLRLHQVARRELPLSAVDERGADVRPALRENDDVYVSNLTPTRYQGVVEPHDLVLDLGPSAGEAESYLFLRGWIYPTDASINVALAQQPSFALASPSLEVRDAKGRWQRAVADIGFPSGKDKTVIVDLAGKFPTKDHHVRIRTNMQIYWDQAFVAGEVNTSPVKVTPLAPIAADLHFRGFSRMYRKGGRYGPYWFDYGDVTKESPWRTIEGAFTRFGDVLPLLQDPDDRYVVMAAGDEASLQFDATSASSLPKGWKRDFLLYTDGWIKDSDLNTAYGTTVGPLPFHRIQSYPYAPGDSYPADAAHQRYVREYNTRVVGTR